MLRPRPASHNKRLREFTLLIDSPLLGDLDMLKARREEAGVRYVIYDGSLKTYYITYVGFDGKGRLLARHRSEREDDLDWLLNLYEEDLA